MFENYLKSYCKEEILEIIHDENVNKYFSININFLELFENDPTLGNEILDNPSDALNKLNEAAINLQTVLNDKENIVKNNVNCRIYSLPTCAELNRNLVPDNDDVGKFLQFTGTVVRISASKLLEFQRQYLCIKCKNFTTVKAEFERNHLIEPPKFCTNCGSSNSKSFAIVEELKSGNCCDYQEIKLQEMSQDSQFICIPDSIRVTLDYDLVDSCKPGDTVTVCGIVKRVWKTLIVGKPIEIDLALKANHVQLNNKYSINYFPDPEEEEKNSANFEKFWIKYTESPLNGRDLILKSFCPEIYGLYLVKLAICCILAGGGTKDIQENLNISSILEKSSDSVNSNISRSNFDEKAIKVRSEGHLLMVGDPGTGKSELLRFAAKVIPRSVLTTGVGSTAAGLTVAAVMEDGEWQLEGGALVMADGGICCIDEFNSMRPHDRTSIHEAMEQQTISVAKASIVCKLSTKCSILAACNPKSGSLDLSQDLCLNVALASPLLSRFDLIFFLRDRIDEEWDRKLAHYILYEKETNNCQTNDQLWSIQKLQNYFIDIKKFNPKLTDPAAEVLSKYYQRQRSATHRSKARTTVRLLDSLLRLSQGHARLMYHQEIELVDAIFAVILADSAMDPDSSMMYTNPDIAHMAFLDNPDEEFLKTLNYILDKLNLLHLIEKDPKTNDPKENCDYIDNKNIAKDSEIIEVNDKEIECDLAEISFKDSSSSSKIKGKGKKNSKTIKKVARTEMDVVKLIPSAVEDDPIIAQVNFNLDYSNIDFGNINEEFTSTQNNKENNVQNSNINIEQIEICDDKEKDNIKDTIESVNVKEIADEKKRKSNSDLQSVKKKCTKLDLNSFRFRVSSPTNLDAEKINPEAESVKETNTNVKDTERDQLESHLMQRSIFQSDNIDDLDLDI